MVNPDQRYIADWRCTTRSSSDYLNTCDYDNYEPHTGEGYAGIIMWDPAGTREYISATFSEPMIAGECYYIEFYVALKEGYTKTIEEFQFSFSAGSPVNVDWPPPAPLIMPVHYEVSTPITSYVWEKRSFMYTASGGEDWVTIGNFEDNASTTVIDVTPFGSTSAYYYIDDLTISKLDLGDDLSFCPGESAEVISNITCPSLTYNWSNGDTGTSTIATSEGTLSLTISGDGTCDLYDEVEVIFLPAPIIDAGPDVTMSAGESVELFSTGATDPVWSPPSYLSCTDCISTIATPPVSTTYYVTGVGDNGCTGIDSVRVIISEIDDPGTDNPSIDDNEDPFDPDAEVYLYVPNAFTPNGDGGNDVFLPQGGPFQDYSFKIFNRWGNLVFETTDPSQAWDGSFEGVLVPVDVYVYQIMYTVNDYERHEVFGHVTVLR